MARFKQKNFLIGALTLGATAIGMKQSADQAKEQEEQAQQLQKQNAQMTKALNRIAENAKTDPQAAAAAGNIMQQKLGSNINCKERARIKLFGAPLFTMNNIKGFGKDVAKIAWGHRHGLDSGIAMGGSMAAASYAGNKIIQHDMKKNGLEQPEDPNAPKQSNWKRNLALGTLATAGLALGGYKAGKAGYLGKTIQGNINNITKPIANKYNSINKSLKSNYIKSDNSGGLLGGPLGIGMSVAFGAGIPLASYYTSGKQQLKDQVAQTQEQNQQKTYSAEQYQQQYPYYYNQQEEQPQQKQGMSFKKKALIGLGTAATLVGGYKAGKAGYLGKAIQGHATKLGEGINKYTPDFVKTIGNKVDSGTQKVAEKASGWFGNISGKDRKGAANLLKNSNNKLSNAAGNFIDKHRTIAAVGSLELGTAVMGYTWGGGEKVGNKLLRTADPNAYKYADSQEQQIN